MAKKKQTKKQDRNAVDALPAGIEAPPIVEETRLQTRSQIMTPDGRMKAVELFALGYTVRYVSKALKVILGRVPNDQELLRIAIEEGDSIDRLRGELEEVAFSRGIASKAVRMDRLNRLAEELEPGALAGDTKAAGAYLNTLKQAQVEVEPLGLRLVLPKDDPWAELLTSLRETAQKRLTSVEETPTDKSDPVQTKSTSSPEPLD